MAKGGEGWQGQKFGGGGYMRGAGFGRGLSIPSKKSSRYLRSRVLDFRDLGP